MKTILSLLITITFFNVIKAQTTAIPDANFEQALIDLGLDTGVPNGTVPTANIDTLTDLNVSYKSIQDLTGIEDFTALTVLNCGYNQLTSLNITQNTVLTRLYCSQNQLSNLNVTQNTALTYLVCYNNQLTSLDVTQNTALTGLNFYNNQLTSLDVTQNTALTDLNCYNNQLTSLDVTQNTALTNLLCGNNQLTSLDVTQNTALTKLFCDYNQIYNLDVTQNNVLIYLICNYNQLTSVDVTQNTALTNLDCSSNPLHSLNITQNTALKWLVCKNNQLTNLNISQNNALKGLQCDDNYLNCINLKNTFLTDSTFQSLNNPNLTCIEVIDTTWLVWWIDPWSFFSTNCNNNCSGAPCSVFAGYTSINNGNGNYSFTNTSLGSFNKTHWAFGDGNTSTFANPNHTFSANGTYVVVLTINDSTIGSSCIDYFLETIIVTGVVSPLQCNAGFTMYPAAGNVTVINSSTGTNLSYLWDFGDGNTSTVQFPTHTYATAGPFYICLTVDDGAGCNNMYCDSIGQYGVVFNKQNGFTINVISPIVIGIENILALNTEVRIFPNPTSNQLSIDTDLEISVITILDLTGKMILTTKQNTKTLSVADLSNGIYFIKLVTDEGTITKKFVKQ